MSSDNYSAKNIGVLKGLDPVKERPGMYTKTENPNHIIEEVIDNDGEFKWHLIFLFSC